MFHRCSTEKGNTKGERPASSKGRRGDPLMLSCRLISVASFNFQTLSFIFRFSPRPPPSQNLQSTMSIIKYAQWSIWGVKKVTREQRFIACSRLESDVCLFLSRSPQPMHGVFEWGVRNSTPNEVIALLARDSELHRSTEKKNGNSRSSRSYANTCRRGCYCDKRARTSPLHWNRSAPRQILFCQW